MTRDELNTIADDLCQANYAGDTCRDAYTSRDCYLDWCARCMAAESRDLLATLEAKNAELRRELALTQIAVGDAEKDTARLRDVIDTGLFQRAELRTLLADIAERLRYVTVQVDRETWGRVRASGKTGMDQ